MTAPVLRAVDVRRSPQDCFEVFTTRLGAWWPLDTHGLFHDRSAGVAFEDGALVERSLDGEVAVWGRVTVWEPGRRLALTWHPGVPEEQAAGTATTVEVTFTAVGDGTRVEVVHSGWERLGDRAPAARRGYAGPNAWGWVLEHLADTLERRVDGADDVPDTSPVRVATDAFLAQARAGGFADPADGGWSAAEVVAHVALTTAGLAAVTRRLLTDSPPVFDNALVERRDCLGALVAAHDGDLGALADLAERLTDEYVLLLDRLDAEQLATAVPTRIVDGGRVAVDEPVPWGAVAVDVHSRRHLPAHTEQLRALRP